jgi:hypothetical protein
VTSPDGFSKSNRGRIVTQIISAGLLRDGETLRFAEAYNVDSQGHLEKWLLEVPNRRLAYWHNSPGKPLEWAFDGERYSPTALARKIVREATGITLGALRGTGWWTVGGRTLIEILL